MDALALSLFRSSFATLDQDTFWIFLCADASPQSKGMELFAASFDIIVDGLDEWWRRKLFAQVRIGRHMVTVLGKLTALLWQIWLQVGPDFDACRVFCNNVFGVLTDLGTEENIPRHPDCLIEFFEFLKCPIPRGAVRQRRLFPRALPLAGWQHTWDGVLCYCLCMLPWFPHWLRVFKAASKFVRNVIDDLVAAYKTAGLLGAVAVLENLAIKKFIEWRWGTLDGNCMEMATALGIFRATIHVVSLVAQRMKDTVTEKLLAEAFTSEEWYVQFQFVKRFAHEVGKLQSFWQFLLVAC